MVPGGPTDDDGWGDAADEQQPRRPTIAAWDDDDAPKPKTAPKPKAAKTAPKPKAEPEPAPTTAPEHAPATAPAHAPTTAPEHAHAPATAPAHAPTTAPEHAHAPAAAPEDGPARARATASADPGAETERGSEADLESDAEAGAESWKGTLAEAAGVDVPPPRPPSKPLLSRRGWFYAVAAAVIIALLTAGGVASQLNSERLYLVCGDSDVRAERGRWFPWGQTRLDGDRWKPFELPGTCESRELDSETDLEEAFLELLVSRLNGMLAAESPGDVTAAETLIDQGMALSRSPEHKERRAELERLRGDVEYWRGRAEVTGAIERLEAARGHVDEAVKIGPRHASDAGDWMTFIDGLIKRAKGGPGAEPAARPTRDAAVPVAPTTDAAPPAVPIVIPDAGPVEPTTPDAGVPRGGVLL